MIINVAVTGAVPQRTKYPRVPETPEQVVTDVLECAEAGATVFHLHARDEQGRPVHRPDLYMSMIEGIRSSRPDVVLGVTTSSRVGGHLEDRMIGLNLPNDLLPEFASLTLGSFNFPDSVSHNPPDQIVALLERMGERGIRPELEVFELGMIGLIHTLRDRGLIPDPPVVNILLGSHGAAPANVGDLERMVSRLPSISEWAAAGIGMYQRPMNIAAAIMGGNIRTGLEDNPRGDGRADWSNADAVRLAVAAADLAGRPVETPAGTRSRYGLALV
jgi:uncharacterized protein (DUF849 family)